MDLIRKYLTDYFGYKLSLLFAGKKNYEQWRTKNYALNKTRISNKELALEMEAACTKNGGFLTYADFLKEDQFGTYGYHSKHKDHGATDTHNRWGKAIAALCKDKEIHHVIEFGPGTGDLAIAIIKQAKRKNFDISWSGVELNQELQKKIRDKFQKEGLKVQLAEQVNSIDQLKTRKKSIVVFSYSLDSVAPQIFINTKNEKSFPNALIGIKVENGILEEVILTGAILGKKGIFFEDGIYSQDNGTKFDITSWKLFPYQRAYIPVAAFSILKAFTDRFQDSLFIIIDEVREPAFFWNTQHLCLPRDLHKYKRDLTDLEKAYREAGENLLYYPTFFLTLYKFIHRLGFRSVEYEIEQKMAKDLSGDHWVSLKGQFLTYSFLAWDKKNKSKEVFPLEFPQFKLL